MKKISVGVFLVVGSVGTTIATIFFLEKKEAWVAVINGAIGLYGFFGAADKIFNKEAQ